MMDAIVKLIVSMSVPSHNLEIFLRMTLALHFGIVTNRPFVQIFLILPRLDFLRALEHLARVARNCSAARPQHRKFSELGQVPAGTYSLPYLSIFISLFKPHNLFLLLLEI